jgi:putative flippase GtrA
MIELIRKHWDSEMIWQFIRYAVTGIVINSVGFCIYLFLTWLGLNPIFTMSFLYCFAVILSFFGSKNYAFNYKGSQANAAARYIIAHIGGYLLNLSMLLIFHEWLAFPHQFVQAGAIVVVAIYLFVTFRLFVFRTRLKRI